MPIRTKLLLLLLGISLVPVGVLGWLGQRSTRQLGTRLAAESRQVLTHAAAERLEAVIDSHARILRRQADLLSFIVREQAREMEALLAAPPPGNVPVYPASAFDEGTVPGLTPSERQWRIRPQDEPEPVMISHHASVFIAPGSSPSQEDVLRAAAMGDVYRAAARGAPEVLYWQFTGLESGVLSVYPGHGGLPPEYDFRKRIWYEAARSLRDLAWIGPSADATTGEVVLSLVSPVRTPDGTFAGVTGVDVRVEDILGEVDIPAKWRRTDDTGARVLLVTERRHQTPGGPLTDEGDVVIVGQQSYADGGLASWDRLVEVERLADKGGREMAAIVEAIREGHSGQRRVTFEGRDSIVAFGAMQAGSRVATLMLVVPVEVVTAEAVDAQERVLHETRLVLRFTALALAVVTLAVAIIARIVARSVVRPIDELVAAAGALADGDFDVRVKVRSRDELGRLARTFNRVAPQLRDRVEMRSALAVAQEVQQHLLPKHAPRVPGLDVAGASWYCDETGGDYYDFLEPDPVLSAGAASPAHPGRVVVAVGDVTGHGIAAALLMTTARALLRGRLLSGGTLADSVSDVNAYLSEDASNGRFMTLFLLAVTSDGAMRWVSAGHDPAIVYVPSRDDFVELAGTGIPLGVDPARHHEEHGGEALEPGGVVVIGTDGIWETRNDAGEMFGKDRLREAIRCHAHLGAERVMKGVMQAVAAFRGARPQDDDITLVAIAARNVEDPTPAERRTDSV